MIWGMPVQLGNYVQVFCNENMEYPTIKEILMENMRDVFEYGYYKHYGDVSIVKKFPDFHSPDPLGKLGTIGWKCMALPVSSMESFQHHAGMAVEHYFRSEFQLPKVLGIF